MKLPAEALCALDDAALAKLMQRVSEDRVADYLVDWSKWARPEQLPPPGDWRVWLIMAGRGFGKTRAGAEWVRHIAENEPGSRIALVAATPADARSIMVEGAAGIMALGRTATRPVYESSLRRISWANGSIAMLYGASDPESLRGPEHDAAWCDEIGKWTDGEAAWDNLLFTLRAGPHPRVVATTTPRPVPLVRRLLAEPGVMITRGATSDNRLHLARSWRAGMNRTYAGTRLGRQELGGELIEDADGALWSRAVLDRCRIAAADIGKPVRVVIGVDPPAGAAAGGGDACGIVVAALLRDGRLAVVEDATLHAASPAIWAQAVARAAARWNADRVVAERNQGGAMVAATLLAVDPALPVVSAWASISKGGRAEPIALRYERGDVVHAGAFAALEDELCGLMIGGGYAGPGRSPDRADACVWALNELGRGQGAGDGVRVRVV